MDGPDPIRDCIHGHLKRKCEVCYLEAELSAAEAAETELGVLRGRVAELSGDREKLIQRCKELEAHNHVHDWHWTDKNPQKRMCPDCGAEEPAPKIGGEEKK